MQLAFIWLKEKKITFPNDTVAPLKKEIRYLLIKQIFKSEKFNLDLKMQLLAEEKALSFSLTDVYEELGCLASLPSDDDKMKCWEQYNTLNKFNNKEFEASSKCFYNFKNREQCEMFADLYFVINSYLPLQ